MRRRDHVHATRGPLEASGFCVELVYEDDAGPRTVFAWGRDGYVRRPSEGGTSGEWTAQDAL